jgi:hypothetical protein
MENYARAEFARLNVTPVFEDESYIVISDYSTSKKLTIRLTIRERGKRPQEFLLRDEYPYNYNDQLKAAKKRIKSAAQYINTNLADKSTTDVKQNYDVFYESCRDLFKLVFGSSHEAFDALISHSSKSSVILVDSPKSLIPFEFLLDSRTHKKEHFPDLLGTRFAFRKYLGTSGSDFSRVADSDKLSVAVIYDDSDADFVKEADLIATYAHRASVMKIPTSKFEDAKSLFEHIGKNKFQVFHFVGHYVRDTADNKYSYFEYNKFKLFLYELDGFPEIDGAVVFLNLCDTSAGNTWGTTNCPDTFLRKGACAVIGVDIPIDEDFARLFCKTFYEHTLNNNKSLDAALLLTRLEILKETEDYLGFFYSYYGYSSTQFFNPPTLITTTV